MNNNKKMINIGQCSSLIAHQNFIRFLQLLLINHLISFLIPYQNQEAQEPGLSSVAKAQFFFFFFYVRSYGFESE